LRRYKWGLTVAVTEER